MGQTTENVNFDLRYPGVTDLVVRAIDNFGEILNDMLTLRSQGRKAHQRNHNR